MTNSADVLLRTGFETGTNPAWLDQPWVNEVIQYPLDQPLGPLLAARTRAQARYLIIMDDMVQVDPAAVLILMNVMSHDPSIWGATLECNGLRSVYGYSSLPHRQRQLGPSVGALDNLPAWFAIVNNAHLLDHGCYAREVETPEFLLLGTAARLCAVGLRACRISQPRLELPIVNWIAAALRQNSMLLASDYAQRKSVFVPRQFRVVQNGRLIEINDRPFDDEYSGKSPDYPTFSVICPVFRAKHLRETVDSICSQTWPHWNLRLCIDGPPEPELHAIDRILTSYQHDSRISWSYQENAGTGKTRARLGREAIGDFIVSIDDDDMLSPDTLGVFVSALVAHPDAKVLRGGSQLIGQSFLYLPPRPRFVIDGVSADIFEVNQPFAIATNLVHEVGGFEGDETFGGSGEDSDLFLKVDRTLAECYLIDRPLYFRRLTDQNQTLAKTPEQCRSHIVTMIKRHAASGWSIRDLALTNEYPFVGLNSIYSRPSELAELVCPTRFLDFQNVGKFDQITIDLEVTSACNAVCTFCPREALDRDRRFIDIAHVKQLAKSFTGRTNRQRVVLCGIGEPTLHAHLDDIIRILAASGALVCMTTNGWKLTPDYLDSLVAAGLSEINVSLNAATESTHQDIMRLGGFTSICEQLTLIARQRSHRWPKLSMHVSFVLTQTNEHEVDEFVTRWRNSGVTQVWLHPLNRRSGLLDPAVKPGKHGSLATRYAKDPMVKVDLFKAAYDERTLCQIARTMDFISSDGELLLCALDHGRRHRFGNVSESPLAVLHQHKLAQFVRGVTAQTCHGCDFCPSGGKPSPQNMQLQILR